MKCLRVSMFVLFFSAATFAQSGESLFLSKCASCHAKDGSGKTSFAEKAKMDDLRSPAIQSQTDAQLYESIARGSNHKVYPHAFAMRGMSSGEINALVKHIRGLKK